MRILILLVLLSNIALGQPREPFNNLNISEDSIYISDISKDVIEKLDEKISWIDDNIGSSGNEVELMALTSESSDPIAVENGEWPENTIISINLQRDQKGNVIYYAEYPFSESGDWSIGYEYYFNEITGNIYAFRRMANFFNSMCVDGVLQEESTYYFDSNFKLIGKDYSLTNTDGEAIEDELCYFPYNYEYVIPENIDELVK